MDIANRMRAYKDPLLDDFDKEEADTAASKDDKKVEKKGDSDDESDDSSGSDGSSGSGSGDDECNINFP